MCIDSVAFGHVNFDEFGLDGQRGGPARELPLSLGDTMSRNRRATSERPSIFDRNSAFPLVTRLRSSGLWAARLALDVVILPDLCCDQISPQDASESPLIGNQFHLPR